MCQFTLILERWLHLDTAYFLKGGFFASIQQVVGVSSGLIVSYLIGHHVSPAVFGEYTLIQSVVGMLTFLSLPGIDLALPKSITSGFDSSLTLAARMKFKLSFLGVPALVLFAMYYAAQNKDVVATGLVVAAILFPLINSFTSYPAFLTAKRRFGRLALFSSLSSLFFLVVVGFTALLRPRTVELTTGYLVGLIAPSLIFFTLSLKLIKSPRADPHLPSYATFLTGLSVLPWISGNLGNVILERSLGAQSLAIFAVSSRFLTAVQKNFQVFYKPVSAKLASHAASEHLQVLKVHSLKLILIGALLAAALYFATPPLIRFFFDASYHEAITYGRLLSLALIPLPLSWVASDMLVFQKRKFPQVLTSTIPQCIKLLLFFIIIPTYGIAGLVTIILLERFTEPLIPLWFLLVRARKK